MNVRPRRTTLVLLLSVLLVTGLVGGLPARAAGPPGSSDRLGLSDAQKRALMLDVLEKFVPHAESYWKPSDLTQERTGWFDAVGPGVTQPRGAGNLASVYTTLLVERPDQPSFGGVPREVMLDHTIQSIRHEAYTNKLSGAGYNRWGDGSWQAALETYGWAFAAKLLWDRLDEDTRAVVQRVVVAESDILLTKPIADAVDGNTGAEDNGWNAPLPALASVMFPDHPHKAGWEERSQRLAMNASSRAADEQSSETVDGHPVSDWVETANLFDDFTLENHGFFHPIYLQVSQLTVNDAAVVYQQAGKAVPDAFAFRYPEVWDNVLGPLAGDDGDLVMPAGQDWTSKDYQHLEYLAALATRLQRVDASVAESQALQLVAKRQATHDGGSILGQPQLGYESMLVKRLAFAHWTHKLFGPSPQPTRDQYEHARAKTAGVHQWPDADTFSARQRDAVVTMSWGARVMGLVVPASSGHEDDPVFAAYLPGSGIGDASGVVGPYSCDCRKDYFSTAGSVGTRKFSLTSFPDGMTMLLDRGTGRTFSLGFEQVEGLTGPRPVYSAGGTGTGELDGTWANVADRFGLAVAGGGGLAATEVATGNPHLRVDGSRATGSGNRGAAVYPLVDATTTEALSDDLHQPPAPDGWSALVARAADGTGRVAVARWGGADEASLALRSNRGAPVTERAATVEGDTATVRYALAAPASRGETVRFFARSDRPVQARAVSGQRAELVNTGTAPARTTVTYVDTAGAEHTVTRVLAPAERVQVGPLRGAVRAIDPAWTPVDDTATVLGALPGQLERWRDQRQLSADEYRRLTDLTGWLTGRTGEAARALELEDPDEAAAAKAVRLARERLPQLASDSASLPVRVALTAVRVVGAQRLATAAAELSPQVRLTVLDGVVPGEPATIRASLVNRGETPATGAALELSAPPGWTVTPQRTELGTLGTGSYAAPEFEVTAPGDAAPGSAAELRARLGYTMDHERRAASASAGVTVGSLLTATATPRLRLAAGGWNEALVGVTNHGTRPLTVTVSAQAESPVTAEAPGSVEIAPGETSPVAIGLRNASRTDGESTLTVTARTAAGQVATTQTTLLHSANLALNDVGAPWPAATASSSQAAFPASLANDGATGTFWVSNGTRPGEGPTTDNPQYVGVDLGAPVVIKRLTVVPRTNYGPRAYTIEVSDDGQTWRQAGAVPSAPNAQHSTDLDSVPTRMVRLRITDGYDAQRPPRNVQVAEIQLG